LLAKFFSPGTPNYSIITRLEYLILNQLLQNFVCADIGKANADDQRREDERHYPHLQVGKAVGAKQGIC
jgi:hypothetical protein